MHLWLVHRLNILTASETYDLWEPQPLSTGPRPIFVTCQGENRCHEACTLSFLKIGEDTQPPPFFPTAIWVSRRSHYPACLANIPIISIMGCYHFVIPIEPGRIPYNRLSVVVFMARHAISPPSPAWPLGSTPVWKDRSNPASGIVVVR